MPNEYKWDTRWTYPSEPTITPNWANCTLRSTMNSSIFNQLSSELKNSILPVVKKYNTTAGTVPNGGSTATVTDRLWLISVTEFVSNIADRIPSDYTGYTDNSHQGSTYAFWKSKNLVEHGYIEQKQLFIQMIKDREGTLVGGAIKHNGSWISAVDSGWLRSVAPKVATHTSVYRADGWIYIPSGYSCYWPFSVSPCFAM